MHFRVDRHQLPACALRRSLLAGTTDNENQQVAIKLEPRSARHPQLLYEAKVARHLQGGGAQLAPNKSLLS